MNTPNTQTPPKPALLKEYAVFRCIHAAWDASGNTSVKRIQIKSGFESEDAGFQFLLSNADRLRTEDHYEVTPIYRKA